LEICDSWVSKEKGANQIEEIKAKTGQACSF
jgi:hypothetical protein